MPRFDGLLLAEAFREAAGTSLSSFPLGLLSKSVGCRFINEGVHGEMKGMETGEHFTEHRTESLRKSLITETQKYFTALE